MQYADVDAVPNFDLLWNADTLFEGVVGDALIAVSLSMVSALAGVATFAAGMDAAAGMAPALRADAALVA